MRGGGGEKEEEGGGGGRLGDGGGFWGGGADLRLLSEGLQPSEPSYGACGSAGRRGRAVGGWGSGIGEGSVGPSVVGPPEVGGGGGGVWGGAAAGLPLAPDPPFRGAPWDPSVCSPRWSRGGGVLLQHLPPPNSPGCRRGSCLGLRGPPRWDGGGCTALKGGGGGDPSVSPALLALPLCCMHGSLQLLRCDEAVLMLIAMVLIALLVPCPHPALRWGGAACFT